MNNPAVGEVLRGMQVEAQPLRVGRPLRAEAATAAPASCAEERDLRHELQEKLIHEARVQAEKAGYEEGLRRGQAEAVARAESKVRKAVEDATSALEEQQRALVKLGESVAMAATDLLRSAEDELVALCYEVLCSMLGSQAIGADAVRQQVTALLAEGAAALDAEFRVHPGDAKQLLAVSESGPGGVRWVADPDVASGGCIVRMPGGGLDARLETMLAACKDRLLAARAACAREEAGT